MMYDLEERTIKFSRDIFAFVKKIGFRKLNSYILEQLLRSSASIGANYREANGGSSKKDFRHKISLCRKEAQETKYWIELLGSVEETHKDDMRRLWQESLELTLIFGKIYSNFRN